MTGWRANLAIPTIGYLTLVHPAAAAASCNQSIGSEKAHQLVEQCLMVSPATHPPCNAANTCALIQDEIRRGCTLLGKDAPAFCRSDRPEPWPRSN
jgi:hypothetical protein